jgi:PTS system nitrogen regulatory IIA component
MKIQDLIEKKGVLVDLAATDKSQVLTEMSSFISSLYNLKEPSTIIQRVLERETDMSTGIGYGIAIPHARLETIDHVYMIAARLATPIEFAAIDDQPVDLLFMILSPKNTSAEHTQILSSLSKVMSYEHMREGLRTVKDAEAFCAMLAEGENKYAE